MIRLRQSLDAGLRHPLLGPLLLLGLALLLSFLFLHTAEHDLEQLLISCGMLAAVAFRLVAAPRLSRPAAPEPRAGGPRRDAGLGAIASLPPPRPAYAFPLRR